MKVIFPLLLLFAAAAPVQAQAPMTPAQVLAAVSAAPAGEVSGTFEMTVGSTGASGYQVYLNSAKDYHDPANVTIELDAGPRNKLNKLLGGEAEDLMTGKRIRVTGVAKKIAVKSGAYQVRIRVERDEQVGPVG
jgi:hypothetical protein